MSICHKLINIQCFIFLLLSYSVSISSAQTPVNSKTISKSISGIVTDLNTGEPITNAEIFISGTTIGTITNEKGYFILNVPFFPCILVVDHISYDSFIKNLDGSEHKFQITLKPSLIEVQEIKVAGKSNRKQNLKYFYARFVRENKKKIEILNDSLLLFNKNENEFVAYTREPLIIVNRILGYKIKLKLISFRIFRMEYPGGPEIPLKDKRGMEYGKLVGYFYYEPLKPNSIDQMVEFVSNRRIQYFGSERHFLKSVYHNNVEEQGFKMLIYPKERDLSGFKEFKSPSNTESVKNFIMDADSIEVTYKFGKDRYPYTYKMVKNSINLFSEVSKIYRKGNIFTIREDGTTPDASFIIIGPMAPGTNFANNLPQDYSPF